MAHIELPIWNKCNNNCLMCTNPELSRKNDFFDYNSVISLLEKKIISKKTKKDNYSALEKIGLTGGEPTICPDFFKILKYIRQKFPQTTIELLTNGRMFIYKNFRKKCLSFEKITFIIPIHGHNAKSHNKITQTKNSFQQTINGLKKLIIEKKNEQEIEVRIIATLLNLKIIPKIIKFIKEKFVGINRVVLIFLEFEGRAKINKNRVGLTYQQIQPIFKQIKKYLKVFKEFRLYHFPLCVLEPIFWPYAWRTLPQKEVAFLSKCRHCLYKKYCLGIHKNYLKIIGDKEFTPIKKRYEIESSYNFYHPINFINAKKR